MRNILTGITILTLLFSLSCKPDKEIQQEGCTTADCVSLSGIIDKHDYYLPFKLFNDVNDSKIILLHGEEIDLDFGQSHLFEKSGFYEIVIQFRDETKEFDTILFTLTTEERENAEWGIEAWVPVLFETTQPISEEIEIIYPRRYFGNLGIPFIFYCKEGGERKALYAEAQCISTANSFYIKQGVGSISIPANQIESTISFDIGGKNSTILLEEITESPEILSGEITSNKVIAPNSLIRITGNLSIAVGASLTIHEGTILMVDEGIDINCSGPVIFIGKVDNPVLITCTDANKFWGGFLAKMAAASISAEYTIFSRSGFHNEEGYKWGHAQRQALFYCENTSLDLKFCYLIDHIGQIFYPINSNLTVDNILVQRAKTGGQLNTSEVSITNSVFTDFPDDSQVYQDTDNDALYINQSNATIDNSIFMFAKDDGIDSGGSEGGEIVVSNSRFEACFHEGVSLSSIDGVIKNHRFTNCVFTNCGQGLELGYSSSNHIVIAENCQFTHNYIGIRYGDNYNWSLVNGQMYINNSFSLDNGIDVWNMVRASWSPKLDNMHFENTVVSSFIKQYPELVVISE